MTTLASLRALVRALVEFDPQTYVTEDADLNALIRERADAFAIASRAFLVRAPHAVTAQTGPGPYALALSGVTAPTEVWVDGRRLFDLQGRPGPTSADDLADVYPAFLTQPCGVVAHWCALSPETIELWPAPSQDAAVVVMGTGLHGGLADDAATTRFPADLDRPFAYECAAELLLPRASGSVLERATGFKAIATAAADAYRKRAEEATQGRVVRGGRKSTGRVSIGGRT